MLQLMTSPLGVLVVMLVVVVVTVGIATNTWLRDRPARRSTARQRLVERNPWLSDAVDASRWSNRSNRVRLGWLTSLLVAVAVLAVADRPTSVGVATDDVR